MDHTLPWKESTHHKRHVADLHASDPHASTIGHARWSPVEQSSEYFRRDVSRANLGVGVVSLPNNSSSMLLSTGVGSLHLFASLLFRLDQLFFLPEPHTSATGRKKREAAPAPSRSRRQMNVFMTTCWYHEPHLLKKRPVLIDRSGHHRTDTDGTSSGFLKNVRSLPSG